MVLCVPHAEVLEAQLLDFHTKTLTHKRYVHELYGLMIVYCTLREVDHHKSLCPCLHFQEVKKKRKKRQQRRKRWRSGEGSKEVQTIQ